MSQYLYFIENRQQPVSSNEQRAEIGLSHAPKPNFSGEIAKGPSGGKGWLLNACGVEAWNGETQRWKRRPDGVWVGVLKDALPTPESLQRAEMLPGESLELGGESWQVPRILAYDADANKVPELPRLLDTDDEGNVIPGEVCEQHRWLIDTVDPFLESWTSQRAKAVAEGKENWMFNFSRTQESRRAVRVLSANYRLALVEEAVLLGLFTTDYGPYEVLYAACDCGFCEYVLSKKKAATDTENSPTDAG